jgi:hypothetical protein
MPSYHIFPKAWALIDPEQTCNSARDSAYNAADNCANWTGCCISLSRALGRAARHTLRLDSQGE